MKMKLQTLQQLMAVLAFILLAPLSLIAQERFVSGTVTDETGQGLPGVNILVNGTTQGSITDFNGSYRINLGTVENPELVFSFIGYETMRISVNGQSTINHQMVPDADQLEEVVVVGYGVQKKSDITGSVASIKPEALTQISTPSVGQALQGRISGVQVTSQSGKPGSGMRIRIRGIGTINNSDPLYVVDGFPTANIDFLSPADIESIEVLKDASATAIYGSRGANGVVLVTTKKGKSGKAVFNFTASAGVQTPWNIMEMADATQYATIQKEMHGDAADPMVDYVLEQQAKGTDWFREVFKQGYQQDYALSVTGGNENVKYAVSGSYFDQTGILENTDYSRFTVRNNLEFKMSDKVTSGLSVALAMEDRGPFRNDQYGGVLTGAMMADPVTAPKDVDGNWQGTYLANSINNPLYMQEDVRQSEYNKNNLLGNVWLNYQILPSISFKSQFTANLGGDYSKSYSPVYYLKPTQQREVSSLSEQRSDFHGYTWSNFANFNKEIGDHNIGLMVGTEAQSGYYAWTRVAVTDVPNDSSLQFPSTGKQPSENLPQGGAEESTLLSFLSRANYSYAGKYLLTASVRYDGSSKFLPESRWGLFPSFSLGWNVKEESFLNSVDQITQLKLRGGWGQVGNQDAVAPYKYAVTLTNEQKYPFGNQTPVQGVAQTELSNPELKWETTEMTNIGLDAGFFEDRLTLTADYFIKNTKDMIVAVPVPEFVSYQAPPVNIGTMQNRGIELSLNFRGGLERKFQYEVGVNFSKITNEVMDLGDTPAIEAGNVNKVGNTTRTEEGYEIAYFYGLKTDGIFNSQEEVNSYVKDGNLIQPKAQPGDVKFVDLNNDGVIDGNDRTYLGSATPDFFYGINASASYENFDFQMFISGVQGAEAVNPLRYHIDYSLEGENMPLYRVENHWTEANPERNGPRFSADNPNQNERYSDLYVEDASYIRLKTVQLGYTLPASLKEKMGISKLRIFVAADNLLTFTNYTGLDPEIGELVQSASSSDPIPTLTYGVDMASYPQARTFRAGINLSF
ncbi:TonB-dependent receptor [Limibacter armeniacum]|uniref:SusC/RagA family TonB-linked outer membrane protein n=1 Tax=Limibacter armeniacum TaxID=466084 RepID=UPI002FE5A649